ncbi:Ig-like domain-containing protein [Kitasatospora sp. SolWspMP-SS2h]|uniref:Ig-like domain-containing protein n=1 Tax=Kitasatospora sp. SolWspMP-SS2h TaxID=1305729 RepID=UPI000DBF84C1|nr:Ig-like domain-containing protein [Kitasatospora sp. SolWspMP-SS2h]RAJ35971.1 Ig-like domain-containing protein [Kitasatospora sp. SolWspMP-SS2h]
MRIRKRIAGLLVGLLAASGLMVAPAAHADTTAVLGNNTVGTATDSGDSNYINTSRFVTGAAGGTVSSVSVYVGAVGATPNDQYQVAVYGDVAGKPGPLLGSSASGTLTAHAWNTLPVAATLAPNTPYWLAYNSNGVSAAVNNLNYSTGGQSGYSTGGTAFGTWPSSFGAVSTGTLNYSVYATYTPSGGGTGTPGGGPGNEGPILLVTDSANPYTTYYGEILKSEGLNYYKTADLSTVTSTLLNSYDVVLLAEHQLTAAQTTMFTNWVNTGGRLVAMRPDKQLAGLLGLTTTTDTLADSYLKINTTAAPGAGLTSDTIGFHGTADKYALNGATAVATLYSDTAVATTNPAVTLRTAGAGQAAAFTYDLAKSVVQTRQGNAAWGGQQRDNVDGIQASEMFFGTGGQLNWNNLDKAQIPIADEQQRLLANLITTMDAAKKPLPKFWYFPRDAKAVVVMTGDDHGIGGTAGRFDGYVAQSPVGCNVANWECVRASSYIYTDDPITDAQAKAYSDQGFEIGVHVTTNCTPWGTPADLQNIYTTQIGAWRAKYPSLPNPDSTRTHCVEWDDWATQAKTKLANGIRLDTDYYYYPASFVQDRPGYFNGTGLPMKYADSDGSTINEYQATTELTDESGQSMPSTVNTLLDNAYNSKGYYTVLTANIHTDYAASTASDQVIASAKAHGTPVVSGRQLLTWLDARNGSAFSGMAWTSNALSFSITGGANGLRAMVPVNSSVGTLTGVKQGTTNVSYRIETIHGISYAFFDGNVGSYTATYGMDTTAPTVTGSVPANGATGVSATAPVKASFSEPVQASTVNGTNVTLKTTAGSVAVPGAVALDAATNTVTFTPSAALSLSTGYTLSVANVKDLAGNTQTAAYTAAFTTAGAPPQTIGNSAVGTLLDDTDSNHLNGSKITTGASAIALTSLNVHTGQISAAPNNQFQIAVYSDNAGSPDALLATSSVGTLSANAWNSAPITYTLAANTTYWVVYNSNGTSSTVNNMHYSSGPAGSGAYSSTSVPFGTFPAGFGTAVKDNLVYSLYGTY